MGNVVNISSPTGVVVMEFLDDYGSVRRYEIRARRGEETRILHRFEGTDHGAVVEAAEAMCWAMGLGSYDVSKVREHTLVAPVGYITKKVRPQ
jgi:hypothetical protein